VERGFFATTATPARHEVPRPRRLPSCYTSSAPSTTTTSPQVALRYGAGDLNATTAESLIREDSASSASATNRAHLYADWCSSPRRRLEPRHARGLRGYTDPCARRRSPQGIKEVIELPPRAVEDASASARGGRGLRDLVRNGTLRGRPVHLNMGGFLYTNRAAYPSAWSARRQPARALPTATRTCCCSGRGACPLCGRGSKAPPAGRSAPS